jgi:hypothetical protein
MIQIDELLLDAERFFWLLAAGPPHAGRTRSPAKMYDHFQFFVWIYLVDESNTLSDVIKSIEDVAVCDMNSKRVAPTRQEKLTVLGREAADQRKRFLPMIW